MWTANQKCPLGMWLAIGILFTIQMALADYPASAQDAEAISSDILAAQIRSQGFKCDTPQSARRDPQAQRPDQAVWTLKCKNGSYRVRLVPDQAAKVEALD